MGPSPVEQVYGMVIKTQPVGEYDKLITLLTKERGKITAFARGARRQNSALMGVTRVFATGKFNLREGKDSYNLYSAQIDNFFEPLFSDLEGSCYGTYFLELADYYSREMLSDPQLLKLIYVALTALSKDSIPNKLVRRVYELRAMVISGEYDAEPLSDDETIKYTWEFVTKTPVTKLYTFNLTEEKFEIFEKCVDHCLKKYVDREMKSLEMLI